MPESFLATTTGRFVAIAAVTLGAHLVAVLIGRASLYILRARVRSEARIHTVTGFVTSLIVFGSDRVDIGGQVGIVESVGMRFTVVTNSSGARPSVLIRRERHTTP